MPFSGVVLASLLSLIQQAPSNPPAGAVEGSNTVEEVVVTGRRTPPSEQREAVSAFVQSLSEPTKRGRLARWDQGICPGVVGLPGKHATYIADRIAVEAQALGLGVGEPGCRPDILILVTSDANKAASEFRERYPRYFATNVQRDRLEAGEGSKALQRFLQTERPVRSWHVAKLATADGRPISWIEIKQGVFVPASIDTASSGLASAWKNDLSRVLIIVDAGKLRGVTYEQLASYLAMISLAQLDPDAQIENLTSIMTLFASRGDSEAAPAALTDWDRAYLRGLYAAPADARNLNAQRGAIRRSMNNVGKR